MSDAALSLDDPLALVAALALHLLLVVAALAWLLAGRERRISVLARKVDAAGARLGDQVAALQAGLAAVREEAAREARTAREEAAARIDGLGSGLRRQVDLMAGAQRERFETFATRLSNHRTATGAEARALREEVDKAVAALSQSLFDALAVQARSQSEALARVQGQVKDLMEAGDRQALGLRASVEGRLDALRLENEAKLEQMRLTVDEKLQGTLERRLGASFNAVNENLERVYKSVGEMQSIATGVGDLKRVLTNVKTRGAWGEAALGMLLEQTLTGEQYAENVEVAPGSRQRVEYAVRLPGDGETPVWLPIDAKMPTEAWERLMDAAERADAEALEAAQKDLEKAVRTAARDIGEKYVAPPHSTDFGIMFLPTEGLYAEVIRRPGLMDALQREHRVLIAGPTTLTAILTSLRMGFRTLAIKERSSDVWRVLGGVKQEFGRFGDVLAKVEKKLDEAKNTVADASRRSRAVARTLRDVEALPGSAPQAAAPLAASTAMIEDLIEDLDGPG